MQLNFLNRKWQKFTLLMSVSALLVIQGCTTPGASADVYSLSQAQREQIVRTGTIESVRHVKIDDGGGSSGLGMIGGGALGAATGSAFGGGRGTIVTTIAGGLAGALAGSAIEKRVNSPKGGIEITVRLDGNGELRAITQAITNELFKAGDRVRLLSSGGITRVTH